jgi:hypothetical protein
MQNAQFSDEGGWDSRGSKPIYNSVVAARLLDGKSADLQEKISLYHGVTTCEEPDMRPGCHSMIPLVIPPLPGAAGQSAIKGKYPAGKDRDSVIDRPGSDLEPVVGHARVVVEEDQVVAFRHSGRLVT